jgi:hypothetical protein
MKSKLRTIATSIVIGGILITSSGIAFAADSNVSAATSTKTIEGQHFGKNNGIKIGTKMQKNAREHTASDSKYLTDLMDKLIKKGIITEAQAASIGNFVNEEKTAKKAEAEAKRITEQKTKWDGYVSAGLITQTDEDAVLAYYTNQRSLREAEAAKIKAMTEAERKTYFESQMKSHQDAGKNGVKRSHLSELVDAKILTQAQVDSITKYSLEKASENRKAELTGKLDSLVSAGTITAAQESSVIEYLTDKKVTDTKDTQAANPETGKTIKENVKKSIKGFSPLKELVDKGTITQAQADAIKKVLTPAPADEIANK